MEPPCGSSPPLASSKIELGAKLEQTPTQDGRLGQGDFVFGGHLPRELTAEIPVVCIRKRLSAEIRCVERDPAIRGTDVMALIQVVIVIRVVVFRVPKATRGVEPELVSLDGATHTAAIVIDLLDLRRLGR